MKDQLKVAIRVMLQKHHSMVQTDTELNSMDWNTHRADRVRDKAKNFTNQFNVAKAHVDHLVDSL